MGIKVEQAKAMLNSYLHGSTGYTGSLRDAIDTVLPIVEKYQKIEQILKDIPYGGDVTVRRIQEVVEDGKINCNQELMKYEHEGFVSISLAKLDEILKKCGVIEDGINEKTSD